MKLFFQSVLGVLTASCALYSANVPHPMVVQAFTTTTMAPTHTATTRSQKLAAKNMSLQASRRDCFAALAGSSLVPLVVVTTTTLEPPPARAAGDIDYGKVQDLLKSADQPGLSYEYSPRTGRPMYLTEPTEEFKQNEQKSADFKREQLKRKQEFLAVLEKLQTDPNDEKLLAGDLDTMTTLVRAEGGLPLGVTKEEVVKQVRRRKAKKFWSTKVEIAYQDLIAEIRYQQSPDKEKDEDNPF